MAARRPFWKWHRWKSIGFCLWPPSTCIWNLKLKFQSKLDLCSGNHVVYRQTDGQTDKVNPVYPPPTSLGGGIIIVIYQTHKTNGRTFRNLFKIWRGGKWFIHVLNGSNPSFKPSRRKIPGQITFREAGKHKNNYLERFIKKNITICDN